jgi:hypothetical protein
MIYQQLIIRRFKGERKKEIGNLNLGSEHLDGR